VSRQLIALLLAVPLVLPAARMDIGDVVQSGGESFDEAGNDSSAVTPTLGAGVTTGNTLWVAVVHDTSGSNTGPAMTGVTFTQVADSPFTVAAVEACSGGTCRLALWRGQSITGSPTALTVTNAFANVVYAETEDEITIQDYSHGTSASSSTLASGQATSSLSGYAIAAYFGANSPTLSGGFTKIVENCDVTINFCLGLANRTTAAATNYELTSSNSITGWNAYVAVFDGTQGGGGSSFVPAIINTPIRGGGR
jgi:hypothetical protein